MRLARPLGVVSSTFALILGIALAPAALGAPGNNGTVKVEDSVNPKSEPANDPHVCAFDLKFYFADPAQAGDWLVKSWPPTGDKTVVLSGTYDTDDVGFDREPEEGYFGLPNGHYKLFWRGDESKLWKHKVFWVDCASPTPTPTPTPTPPPTPTPTPTPTLTPSSTPSEGPPSTPTRRVVDTPPPTSTVEPAPTSESTLAWPYAALVVVVAAAVALATRRRVK